MSFVKLENGDGRFELASAKLAVNESSLPTNTWYHGPPKMLIESRAAMAKISAQETTLPHRQTEFNSAFI